jgi:hypothetical protein
VSSALARPSVTAERTQRGIERRSACRSGA